MTASVFVAEMHCHTSRYSACAIDTPEEMILAAKRAGLDALIITEHNCMHPEEELHRAAQRVGVTDLVLLSGQEVSCYGRTRWLGDYLVFGATEIRDRRRPEALVERARDEGAVIVAAHPYREARGSCDLILRLDLDAIEVLNGACSPDEDEAAAAAARKMGLPGIGGSDAHQACDVGHYLTVFEEPFHSLAGLVEAIRSGRFRPGRASAPGRRLNGLVGKPGAQ